MSLPWLSDGSAVAEDRPNQLPIDRAGGSATSARRVGRLVKGAFCSNSLTTTTNAYGPSRPPGALRHCTLDGLTVLHPNVADFWRAYEKPSGSYCYARGKCAIAFGASRVNSYNFHYPEGSNNKGGLLNLRAEHYRRMCDADILVFESSYDDLKGGASGEWKERRGRYESRLKDLMVEWRKCKEAKKEWRGIFALGTFARGPPASASSSSSSAKQQESTAEMKACGARGASSSSPDAHQMAEANDVARRIVTGAGYEVFEGAASATLHARSRWFEKDERAGGVVRPSRKVEPLADLEVQLLVGQICA